MALRRIRGYALAKELQEGVYLASRDEAPFILKRQRTSLETDALSALSHPGIMRLEGIVHDTGRAERLIRPGTALERMFPKYAVLEYVPGQDLLDVRRGGPLTAEQFYAYGAQLADAIAHVHAHGMVYNDLKPENVRIGRQATLIDFGSCIPLQRNCWDVVTTQGYRCGQQMHGKNMPQNDVFGLGAVLYFMEHGTSPYLPGTTGNMWEVLEMRELARGPPAACHRDPATSTMLRSMLAVRSADRPSIENVSRFLREKGA